MVLSSLSNIAGFFWRFLRPPDGGGKAALSVHGTSVRTSCRTNCTLKFVKLLARLALPGFARGVSRAVRSANINRKTRMLGTASPVASRKIPNPLLTPLQLETRFWGQNYLDVVQGGVRGLSRGQRPTTYFEVPSSVLYGCPVAYQVVVEPCIL